MTLPRVYHALLLAVLCLASGARAAPGNYEERLVQWGLERAGRGVEPAPDGKVIEEVFIESEDIVAPSDPWPNFFNAFHRKTQPAVIRAELLFGVGDRYDRALAEETERNLRRLFILALARVVPLQGHHGGVALLIVTKDLWSIRLNSQYLLVGTLLEHLLIRPSEQNLLGYNSRVSLDFELKLDTLSVGEEFSARRLFGLPVTFTETAEAIFNRQTGKAEGSFGTLLLQRPFYRLADVWAYTVSGSWRNETTRIFRGAAVWQLPFKGAAGETRNLPDIYETRRASSSASVTRAFGRGFKTEVSAGLGGYRRRYAPPADAALSSEQALWFLAGYVPRSETAVYLFAAVQAFEARYRVMRNVETYAISEDFQVGLRVTATARWANPLILSPTRFNEAGAAGRYTWIAGDNLLMANAAATARYQPDTGATGAGAPWVNRRRAFQLLEVTPFVGIGRFAARVLWDVKDADLNHVPFFLGADSGLRGTAAQALTGSRVLLGNVEYRTRALELGTFHVGGVLFYDVGSAYTDSPAVVHSLGVGLRLLFPQFDVEPIRIDFGYVLVGPRPPWLQSVSSTFGQVEQVRPDFLDTPL